MVDVAAALRSVDLAEARARCRALARRHGENFTTISRLAPREMRTHLSVVYAFCRAVDDLGDEGRLPEELAACPCAAAPPGERRIERLDAFESELVRAWAGRAESPLFVALTETAAAYRLPLEPFRRLIEANRMDQRVRRYATYDELIHYCEHSATPVGRIVLGLYGISDSESARLSDATCTALQLTNFWQDVKRDFAMGRVYLPEQDMARFGVSEGDLAMEIGGSPFCCLMEFEVARARALFDEGVALLGRVSGHLRVDLALFSRGGLAILDKIERQGFDTLLARPTLSRLDKARIFLSALLSGSTL
ncbi:MAG: squalene synthase HpnC [Candidatus Bipolaricaulota bacterium]